MAGSKDDVIICGCDSSDSSCVPEGEEAVVFPTQRDAIEAAKLEPGMERVQVFGEPTERLLGERLCTDEDRGEVVIYHAKTARLTVSQALLCLGCGASSEDEVDPDGRA